MKRSPLNKRLSLKISCLQIHCSLSLSLWTVWRKKTGLGLRLIIGNIRGKQSGNWEIEREYMLHSIRGCCSTQYQYTNKTVNYSAPSNKHKQETPRSYNRFCCRIDRGVWTRAYYPITKKHRATRYGAKKERRILPIPMNKLEWHPRLSRPHKNGKSKNTHIFSSPQLADIIISTTRLSQIGRDFTCIVYLWCICINVDLVTSRAFKYISINNVGHFSDSVPVCLLYDLHFWIHFTSIINII